VHRLAALRLPPTPASAGSSRWPRR
jgi:hypothetical protein